MEQSAESSSLNQKSTANNAIELKIEQRKQAIKNSINKCLKNPYAVAFLIILAIGLIIRLYFFFIASSQTLWWDEAEYMLKAKSIAKHTPETGWAPLRPFFFPYLIAPFFVIGFSESLIRFILVLASIANLILLYIIGKDIFDKKSSLIAVLLMSVFYLDLFYSIRFLVNVIELTLGLVIFTLFFHNYLVKNNKKALLWLFPLTIIGFAIRFTAVIYLGIIILFLILYKGKNSIKIKHLNYSLLIAVALAIPAFFILTSRGINPINAFLTAFSGSTFYRGFHTVIPVATQYISLIDSVLGYTLLVPFLIGLFYSFYQLFILFDKVLFKEHENYRGILFSCLWIIVAFLFYTTIVDIFEDRYFLMAFPVIFLFCGKGFVVLYGLLKTLADKKIIAFLLFCLLVVGAYSMFTASKSIITQKVTSYDSIRDAGLWLKQNTPKDAVIVTSSVPQNTYYSERESIYFYENQSEFEEKLKEKDPEYFVYGFWESSPQWVSSWLQENKEKLEPVAGFPTQDQAMLYNLITRYKIISSPKEPVIVIYKLKQDASINTNTNLSLLVD